MVRRSAARASASVAVDVITTSGRPVSSVRRESVYAAALPRSPCSRQTKSFVPASSSWKSRRSSSMVADSGTGYALAGCEHAGKRTQAERVARCAEAEDLSHRHIGHERAVTKFLATVDVREMHLDDGP